MSTTPAQWNLLSIQMIDCLNEKFANRFEFKQISGRYNDISLTLKLEIAEINENGKVESAIERDFQEYARFYGLQLTDLGRTFTSNGKRYKISGCKPRNIRYPILGTRVPDGKRFKFTVDTVCRGLIRQS